jgi:hypothetical protein
MVEALAVEAGGVLFLDISTRTGFCYGTLANVEAGPVWGVWQLPSGVSVTLGARLAAFENELADAIFEYQPAVVGIEAPMAAGAVGSAHTAELLICLSGVAEAVTWRWAREFRRRSAQTLRAQVCGRCRVTEAESDDRIDVKEAIVKPWVVARGWDITDNNARDAAVGWAFEMGIRADRPKTRKAG